MLSMKIIRLHLWGIIIFSVGMLVAPLASAATYPGTEDWGGGCSTLGCKCAALAAASGGAWTLDHTESTGPGSGHCWGNFGGSVSIMNSPSATFTCDSGDTLSGSTCTDNPPLRDPTVCPASGYAGGFESGKLPASMPDVCVNGCVVHVGSGAGDSASNKWVYITDHTGVKCSESPSTPSPPPVGPSPPFKPACAAGTCSGQVNGVDVCLPCSSPGTQPGVTNTSGTTNPDGSGSSTTTDSKTNPDGSVTTTGTTTPLGPGGTPSGPPTVTTSTGKPNPSDNPLNQFCKDNPQSPLCKTSSFGGTCAGAFTCDGDAVQCAMAREQHVRNCKLFDDTNPMTVLSGQMMEGADPVKNPADLAERETSGISGLLSRGRMLSSSCPSDTSFTLGGQSVTIPFSELCTPMQWLGALAVAFSLLVGGRIVLGA